jgi:hypothetical protein
MNWFYGGGVVCMLLLHYLLILLCHQHLNSPRPSARPLHLMYSEDLDDLAIDDDDDIPFLPPTVLLMHTQNSVQT